MKYDWNGENIIGNVAYVEEERQLFQSLLNGTSEKRGSTPLDSAKVGSVFQGTIIEITDDFVIVDAGLKSEGLVPIAEFKNRSELKKGDSVEVFLDQIEGENNQIVLSHEKACYLREWNHLIENYGEGSTITGRVIRKVKGGLTVDVGIEAFLPGSQIDEKRIKNLDEYIGQEYQFIVLKINRERKNVILSRRGFIEAQKFSERSISLNKFKEGDLCKGTVKNITEFGAFVSIGDVDGLLHITDMAKKVKHPSEIMQKGDELEVIILHVDREKGRLSLGMKRKESTQWEEIEKEYPLNSLVNGTILRLDNGGLWVEVRAGVEGFTPLSQLPSIQPERKLEELFKKDNRVEAFVIGADGEKEILLLRIKKLLLPLGNEIAFLEGDSTVEKLVDLSEPLQGLNKDQQEDRAPLDEKEKRVPSQKKGGKQKKKSEAVPGSLVEGTIKKISPFGVFVKMENGEEGFVHITELSHQKFTDIEEVAFKGQKVVAQVIKFEPDQERLLLSIKQVDSEKEPIPFPSSENPPVKSRSPKKREPF